MRGKQAKILSDDNLEDVLLFAETSRHPLRNKVIVLLSAKAGLRAGEIAHLTWAMVTDPTGAIGTVLELPDHAAKKGSGRVIPLHEDLRAALAAWRAATHSDWSSDRVGAGRANDAAEHRGLVCQCVSGDRPDRVFVAFWAPNLHHSGRPACSPCRRVTARRPAAGWPSVNPDNSAIHRRRY